jgi:hypothetical protein
MTDPYFADGSPAMLELESMVDEVGMRNVLWALAHIADGKADHVENNWQDRQLARVWLKAARKLFRLANVMEEPL